MNRLGQSQRQKAARTQGGAAARCASGNGGYRIATTATAGRRSAGGGWQSDSPNMSCRRQRFHNRRQTENRRNTAAFIGNMLAIGPRCSKQAPAHALFSQQHLLNCLPAGSLENHEYREKVRPAVVNECRNLTTNA